MGERKRVGEIFGQQQLPSLNFHYEVTETCSKEVLENPQGKKLFFISVFVEIASDWTLSLSISQIILPFPPSFRK